MTSEPSTFYKTGLPGNQAGILDTIRPGFLLRLTGVVIRWVWRWRDNRNWIRDLKPRLLARRMEVGGKGDTQSPAMINCVLDLHICRLSCSQWSTVISWLWPWDVSDWQPPVPPFTDTPHRYLLGGGHGSHAGAGLDLRKLHSRHQDSTGSRGGFISDLKKQFLSSARDVSPPAELVVGGGWWSGGAASPPDWGSVSAMLSWVLCSQQPAAATS